MINLFENSGDEVYWIILGSIMIGAFFVILSVIFITRHPRKSVNATIIGISGKIGSGKSTAARYLSKKYGFEEKAYAAKLKEICSILTGLPIENFNTREGKCQKVLDGSLTAGQLLQIVGNGMRKSVYEKVWVDALFADPEKLKKWIIVDVRYPDELQAIKERGGIVIRLEGDPGDIQKENKDGRDLNAPSEVALDGTTFDHIILNNSSLFDLYRQLDIILKSL